jgi:DNA-binding SARP family transcriptional activator
VGVTADWSDDGSLVVDVLHPDPARAAGALDALVQAAGRRVEGGDRQGAVGLLTEALGGALPSSARRVLLQHLAEAEAPISVDDALAHYQELLPLVDRGSDRVRIRISRARLLGLQLRMTEALDEADLAAGAAEDDRDRLSAELAYLSISRQALHTRPLGRQRLEQLRARAATTDRGTAVLLGELAYEESLAGMPVADVVGNAMRALGGPGLAGLHDLPALTRHVVLLTLCWCGELRTAELAADLVIARARAHDNPISAASAHQILCNVHWHRGRLADSAAAAEQVIRARAHGYSGVLPGAIGFRSQALAATGAVEEAVAGLALPSDRQDWAQMATYHGYLIGRARTLLLAGDPEGAYEAALQCGTLAAPMGTVNPAVLPWRYLAARAALDVGEPGVARPLAEEELHESRRFGAPAPVALALRAVAAAAADPETAVPLLEEALALYAATPERWEQAGTQLELAEALAGLGRASEAEGPARGALSIARELGADPMAAAAPVPPTPPAAPTGVTGRPRAPAPTGPARICALGDFSVFDPQDRPVTPAGVAGKVVRILVASQRPLHPEELGDLLWPDGLSPEQTRVRMRNVISRTRVAGFGPLVVRQQDLLGLAPGVTVDADRFDADAAAVLADPAAADALHRALAVSLLYGGDLLPSDPYADWAVLRREQLRMRYLAVTDLACRLAEEAGLFDTAVNLVEAAIRHDPYDEDRYHRAARLLERSGRTSAARLMTERAGRVHKLLLA